MYPPGTHVLRIQVDNENNYPLEILGIYTAPLVVKAANREVVADWDIFVPTDSDWTTITSFNTPTETNQHLVLSSWLRTGSNATNNYEARFLGNGVDLIRFPEIDATEPDRGNLFQFIWKDAPPAVPVEFQVRSAGLVIHNELLGYSVPEVTVLEAKHGLLSEDHLIIFTDGFESGNLAGWSCVGDCTRGSNDPLGRGLVGDKVIPSDGTFHNLFSGQAQFPDLTNAEPAFHPTQFQVCLWSQNGINPYVGSGSTEMLLRTVLLESGSPLFNDIGIYGTSPTTQVNHFSTAGGGDNGGCGIGLFTDREYSVDGEVLGRCAGDDDLRFRSGSNTQVMIVPGPDADARFVSGFSCADSPHPPYLDCDQTCDWSPGVTTVAAPAVTVCN